MKENELAPCPFCGGTDFELCENSIECTGCHACIVNDDLTLEEIMDGWNHRANMPATKAMVPCSAFQKGVHKSCSVIGLKQCYADEPCMIARHHS